MSLLKSKNNRRLAPPYYSCVDMIRPMRPTNSISSSSVIVATVRAMYSSACSISSSLFSPAIIVPSFFRGSGIIIAQLPVRVKGISEHSFDFFTMSTSNQSANERIDAPKLFFVSLVEQGKNPATDFCGGCFHCFYSFYVRFWMQQHYSTYSIICQQYKHSNIIQYIINRDNKICLE